MLKVSAEVNPTEDPEKVKRAISNIFPGLWMDIKGGGIVGESKDPDALAKFKELLKDQKIRAAAESVLRRSIEGKTYRFGLNKQAALMGKVNFVDFDIALGTIEVETDVDFFGS